MNKENSSQGFADKIKAKIFRAHTSIFPPNTRITGGYHIGGFVFYFTLFVFYFFELDKIAWKVRIPKGVGLFKEDKMVSGVLLILGFLTLIILYWIAGQFVWH